MEPKRLLFARVHLLRFAKNATKCVAYCVSSVQPFLRLRKTPVHTFSKIDLLDSFRETYALRDYVCGGIRRKKNEGCSMPLVEKRMAYNGIHKKSR